MTPTDRKKLAGFFDALFEPSDFVSLSLLPVKGTNGKASERTIDARGLKEEIQNFEKYKKQNQFACFTPNPIQKGKPRKSENVAALNCVFVDVDSSLLPVFSAKAHFIFQRDEYHSHLYFLIDRLAPTDANKKRVQELTKKIISLVDGDKAVHDPARVLRIPYAPHVKGGKVSEGYKLQHTLKRQRYTIDELEKLAGMEGGQNEIKEKTQTRHEEATEEAKTELTQTQRLNFLRRHYQTKGRVTAGDGRSRTLFFIGLDCHGWGVEEKTAVEFAHELNEKLCQPPEDSKTVEHQVTSAYRYRKAPFGDFAASVSSSATAAARNKELKRFEELQRVREQLREHVYVTGSEMLIDRKRRLQYTTEKQINNYIAHTCGTRLTLSTLLTEQSLYVADKSDFRPGVESDVFEEGGIVFYNRYVPHILPEPTKNKKAVQVFKDHLHFLTNSKSEFDTLLKFFAFMVQRPGEKLDWAPFIITLHHGVGKSMLAEFARSLFSSRYVTSIEGHELLLPQTDFMEDKILVVGEEIELAEKNVMARLRSLITGKVYRNIAKYQRTTDMTNCVNFMFFSNRIDAVKIDKFDRRLFVIFNRRLPKNAAYYKEVAKAFAENAAEIREFLLGVDLTGFNPQERPPMTHGKQVLIEQSTSEIEMYLESEEENKSGEFEYECVSVAKILDGIKYGAPDSVKKWCGQKSIRFYLRGKGYNDFKGRITEEGETVHRWLWFKGESEAEFKKALARDEALRVKDEERKTA
jgi:hypothetical protein